MGAVCLRNEKGVRVEYLCS